VCRAPGCATLHRARGGPVAASRPDHGFSTRGQRSMMLPRYGPC
jgi:hypothetical protein